MGTRKRRIWKDLLRVGAVAAFVASAMPAGASSAGAAGPNFARLGRGADSPAAVAPLAAPQGSAAASVEPSAGQANATRFYFHSAESPVNDSGTFDTTPPQGVRPALTWLHLRPPVQHPSAFWSGTVGEAIGTLKVDFWHKGTVDEFSPDQKVQYRVDLSVEGTEYLLGIFKVSAPTAQTPSRVIRVFTSSDSSLPIDASTGKVTITITARGMDPVILYDSELYPSGFTTFVPVVRRMDQAVYSTYHGGSERDEALDVAADQDGNVYMTGGTCSADFPATPGAYQEEKPDGCYSAYVSKFSPDGALIYSTYLGGSVADRPFGIAVDASGSAYVVGRTDSPDFPTTPGAFQTKMRGSGDAFVAKLTSDGRSLEFSTFLGGALSGGGAEENEAALGIAVDDTGAAYVTGWTNRSDFPTTPDAFQASPGGSTDAFVTTLTPDGSALAYSTYLGGGSVDAGSSIALDSSGSFYVAGHTAGSDFPTTPGAFQAFPRGSFDVTVTKFSADGTDLVYSTYLGGSGDESAPDIQVGAQGNAYVVSGTSSQDFPTTSGAFQPQHAGPAETTQAHGAPYDAFVTHLAPTGDRLVYSTYLGGSSFDNSGGFGSIAVDDAGAVYLSGNTLSKDFPVTANAFQSAHAGGFMEEDFGNDSDGRADAFVTKVHPSGSSLEYSTYLGGSGSDSSRAVAVHRIGDVTDVTVVGETWSLDFPTTASAAQKNNPKGGFTDWWTAFVTRVRLPNP